MREEVLAGEAVVGEEAVEVGLRPRRLEEFVGQREVKDHLGILLEAARKRGQAADHVLLAGPPGLGKTSLAGIVATELEVGFRVTSGPALAVAILSVHRPTSLRSVLASDDVDALCLVPGVGKKTAARLLLELKARLDLPEGDVLAIVGADGGARGEVREALSSLGYGPQEISEALRDLPDDGDVQRLLKDALTRLATVR